MRSVLNRARKQLAPQASVVTGGRTLGTAQRSESNRTADPAALRTGLLELFMIVSMVASR